MRDGYLVAFDKIKKSQFSRFQMNTVLTGTPMNEIAAEIY